MNPQLIRRFRAWEIRLSGSSLSACSTSLLPVCSLPLRCLYSRVCTLWGGCRIAVGLPAEEPRRWPSLAIPWLDPGKCASPACFLSQAAASHFAWAQCPRACPQEVLPKGFATLTSLW